MSVEKKFYLTKEGLEKVKKEHQALKELKFAKANGEAPKFLHSEDLDSEYVSFQEDLNFIEIRLIELENIIRNSELIKPPKKDKREIVDLGATVVVEIEGQKDEFTLVGSLEANPSAGRISDESPVGRAIIGHRAGETVTISSPIETVYKIKKVSYHSA